jgi:hypothetical protein
MAQNVRRDINKAVEYFSTGSRRGKGDKETHRYGCHVVREMQCLIQFDSKRIEHDALDKEETCIVVSSVMCGFVNTH